MSSQQQYAGEARTRLRWTGQLHERFVLAVAELGGADRATPKSVLTAMAVPGLTLYHLKSHLQKYRQAVIRGGMNDRSSSSADGDVTVDESHTIAYDDDGGDADSSPRSMVQMQREVQRKLQEQIEVQKHLQLRMEAQGRYLQSVLRRAQQVLADHSLAASSPESAKAELSELASAVELECMSSSSPPPQRHRHSAAAAADSCVTTSSSEAESKAAAGAGSKRLYTSDCTVEQPVQGKRAFNFLQRHHQEESEEDDEEEYAGAEDGSSSEIDLNR